MPCHNYVYDPALVRGRELAREGKFGRITSFWMVYNQSHDASAMAPGLTMRELCIHHAYAVLFFLGRPSSVVAVSGNARSPDSRGDDQVMMVFKTDGGAIANVWGSFAAADRTRDPWTMIYKLLGTEGGFSFSWGDIDFRDAPLTGWDRAAYHESFRHVYEHLAKRCLAAGEAPLSTLADARDALRMIEAAEKALDGASDVRLTICRMKAPVTMPMIAPRPPVSARPPMTQIAIASSSRKSWGVEVAELIRVVLMMPANVARPEQMTKARSFVRTTLMPTERAASRLPPAAKKWLPGRSRFRNR